MTKVVIEGLMKGLKITVEADAKTTKKAFDMLQPVCENLAKLDAQKIIDFLKESRGEYREGLSGGVAHDGQSLEREG